MSGLQVDQWVPVAPGVVHVADAPSEIRCGSCDRERPVRGSCCRRDSLRECQECGVVFVGASNARYCSQDCRYGPTWQAHRDHRDRVWCVRHWLKSEGRACAVLAGAWHDHEPCSGKLVCVLGGTAMIAAECAEGGEDLGQWAKREVSGVSDVRVFCAGSMEAAIGATSQVAEQSWAEQRLLREQRDAQMQTYAIWDGDAFKLGKAKSPDRRRAELQTGNARHLRLYAVADGGDLEAVAHGALAEARLRGEWFRDCQAVREWIAENMRELGVDRDEWPVDA